MAHKVQTTMDKIINNTYNSTDLNDIISPNDWTSFPAEKIEPQKYDCLYCQGNTYDDDRGNCCACGAPRNKLEKRVSQSSGFGITMNEATLAMQEFAEALK